MTLALAAASLAHPTMVAAAEGDAPPVGGGDLPPVAVAAEATPAPGAQPTPPADLDAPVVEQPAGNASHEHHATHTETASQPIATPVKAPAPVTSGGGSSGVEASASSPSAPLPFTGPGDTILVIALAGMFAPIGVLLYCIARRSELRWLRRHLSMPRFEWTER